MNRTQVVEEMSIDAEKTTRILEQCHHLMTNGMSQSLSAVMDETDDVLFDLLRHCSQEEHVSYFRAMRELRQKRPMIEAGFRKRLDSTMRCGPAAGGTGNSVNADHEEPDPEISLAQNLAEGRIRTTCREALRNLDEHMHQMLDKVEADKTVSCNVYPETVCRVFQDTCETIEAGTEIKLILFKLFEKYATTGLQEVCEAMAACLSESQDNPALTRLRDVPPAIAETAGIIQEHTPARRQEPVRPRPQPPEGRRIQVPAEHVDLQSGTNGAMNQDEAEDKNYFIIANRIVRSQIQQHIEGVDVPDFIRTFLYEHWSKLLFKIHIRSGKDTGAWQHAIEVIDDLVKSVDPEAVTNGQNSFAQKLPNLIQRLKYGMNVIPVPVEVRDRFIQELRQYHKLLLDRQTEPTGVKSKGEFDITVPGDQRRSGPVPFMNELLVDK